MVTEFLPAVTGATAKASACYSTPTLHIAAAREEKREAHVNVGRRVTDVGVERAPTEGRETGRVGYRLAPTCSVLDTTGDSSRPAAFSSTRFIPMDPGMVVYQHA